MEYNFTKVQEAIDEKGITLQELAKKVGVDHSTIVKALKRNSARQSTAKGLVKALRLRMKDIVIARGEAA